MTTNDEQIGRNLASIRGDMSQKDLAEEMRKRGWKWSQATVWSIEKGERPLRLAEAAELAAVLDKPFSLFLAEDEFVQVHLATQVVMAADRYLRDAIREYERARFLLAMNLDQVNPSGYVTALGESWIDVSAHDVVDLVHAADEGAAQHELHMAGTTAEEVAANQLEGKWITRLAKADRDERQAEA